MALLVCLPSCGSDPNDDEGRGFETGPLMRPGEDCTYCHRPGSEYEHAPHWTAAGTVYGAKDAPADRGVEGVRVIFSDASGQELETLLTNRAGNFYTASPLPSDFRVALEYGGARIEMPCPPPSGGCAKCHSQPPIGFAPGRIYVPQAHPASPAGFDCDAWMPE